MLLINLLSGWDLGHGAFPESAVNETGNHRRGKAYLRTENEFNIVANTAWKVPRPLERFIAGTKPGTGNLFFTLAL